MNPSLSIDTFQHFQIINISKHCYNCVLYLSETVFDNSFRNCFYSKASQNRCFTLAFALGQMPVRIPSAQRLRECHSVGKPEVISTGARGHTIESDTIGCIAVSVANVELIGTSDFYKKNRYSFFE